MAKLRRKRPKIGDVLEIATHKGLAYAQYTHWHRDFGYLVRVLPFLFPHRPINLCDSVQEQGGYFTFVYLNEALRGEIVRIVHHCDIPDHSQQFPLFKDGVKDPSTGRVQTWWLWDGERTWRVHRLTKDQRDLPIRAIWNDILLSERIARGWSPADEA